MNHKYRAALFKAATSGDNMDHDTTQDNNMEENYEGEHLDLPDLPLPDTSNVLYSILSSLNQNIADFYTYVKFNNYLSDDQLKVELLKRSMGIHRDFAALFLHTKEEMILMYPDFVEKTEKLIFNEKVNKDCIKHTYKICKVVNEYKAALYREGYLPDFRRQLPLFEM